MLGEILAIQHEKKNCVGAQRQGSGDLAIKIQSEPNILAGRHFLVEDQIISFQDRTSLDKMVELYGKSKELSRDDWDLMFKLKAKFNIT